VLLVAGIVGCNQTNSVSQNAQSTGTQGRAGDKFILAAEPVDARGVIETRKEAKDGDAIAVVGRVGGSKEPMVKGRTAFTIVDVSLKSCRDTEGDNCPTPWDYCCSTKEELARSSVMIKFVDEQGKTLAHDAKEILGIEPLNTVVVKGHARRDPDGNLTVLADGIFVRSR
jgi:hypothetical protein